jgi:hypothetical protein
MEATRDARKEGESHLQSPRGLGPELLDHSCHVPARTLGQLLQGGQDGAAAQLIVDWIDGGGVHSNQDLAGRGVGGEGEGRDLEHLGAPVFRIYDRLHGELCLRTTVLRSSYVAKTRGETVIDRISLAVGLPRGRRREGKIQISPLLDTLHTPCHMYMNNIQAKSVFQNDRVLIKVFIFLFSPFLPTCSVSGHYEASDRAFLSRQSQKDFGR